MLSMRKLPVAVAVAAAFALAGAVAAHVITPQPQVSVEIVDRAEGRVLPIYVYEGRRYVVGKPGNEYAIRVRNTSGERILAVMSVDGVNVITGDTASPAQSGYVLPPNGSADIAGWRKSLSRTAAFYFTTLPDSYAVRTGRPDNVGVIGVAVYRERAKPMQYGNIYRQDAARSESKDARGGAPEAATDAASAAGKVAAAPAPSLGTGYGRNENSYASYTEFERASDAPTETIAIYYDSYANLLAQGVPLAPPPIARARPEPFPDRGRFAPEPR
jgi:hypothetical protein